MNGGILDAVEVMTTAELADAVSGYRFYDLESVASLLVRARRIFETAKDLELHERALDLQYASLVPTDSFLTSQFQQHLKSHPSDFADP